MDPDSEEIVEAHKTNKQDGNTADALMATDVEAATEAARSLADGELLRQIVNFHAFAFCNFGDGAFSEDALDNAFESAYNQGCLLFSHYAGTSGDYLMREVDDVTATGRMDMVQLSHIQEAPVMSLAANAFFICILRSLFWMSEIGLYKCQSKVYYNQSLMGDECSKH